MSEYLISTIEKFPGTVMEATGCKESWLDEWMKGDGKNEFLNPTFTHEDFLRFSNEYLINKTRLDEIPNKVGITSKAASAWAADIIGIIRNLIVEEVAKKSSELYAITKKNDGNFDIYEYAEKFDVDYYDMHTGRTYLVQEYNRAKRFGLPTVGIRVVEDGVVIGYACKND